MRLGVPILLILASVLWADAPARAQSAGAGGAGDWNRILSDVLHARRPGDVAAPSEADIAAGLRLALTRSAVAATDRLKQTNGFWGDPKVRIGLPGALGDLQRRLAPFGMSGPLDNLQFRINRAAESAMPTARKLAVDAVAAITFEDAVGILRGGDTAATDFLRRRTEAGMAAALRPYMDDALKNAGALKAMEETVARYGLKAVSADARGWLSDEVTATALDGVFHYVADQERAIRADPLKRTDALLRKVFGG